MEKKPKSRQEFFRQGNFNIYELTDLKKYPGTKNTNCRGKPKNIIELLEIRTPLNFTYSKKKSYIQTI